MTTELAIPAIRYPAVFCTSHIVGVVVHARGAVVTRRVEVVAGVATGDVECIVPQITPGADPGSARVILPSGARRLVSLRSSLHVPEQTGARGASVERVRLLAAALKRCEDEHGEARAREEALASWQAEPKGKKALELLGPAARARAALDITAVVQARLNQLVARRFELEERMRELRQQIEAAQLDDQQSSDEQRMGEGHPSLQFIVRFGGEGELEHFELSYVVEAAQWWPLYSLHLSEGGARAEVAIEALVAQCSGEDWSEVAIALSTATLAYDARLPKLASMRLGRAQGVRSKGYREAPAGLDKLFVNYDSALEALDPYHRSRTLGADYSSQGPPPTSAQMKRSAPRPSAAPMPELASFELEDGAFDEMESAGSAMEHVSRSAMAPSASFGAPPSPAKRRSMAAAAPGSGGGAWQSRSEPEVPGAIEPADAWLDFDSLVLGGVQSANRGRLRVRAGAAAAVAGDIWLSEAQAQASRQRLDEALASSGSFDYRYETDARVDVPSDARAHRIQVTRAEAKSALFWRAVPRQDAAVYREARLTNPFSSPLLTSQMSVYVDGRFLAETRLEKVDAGAQIRVGLGVDERIRVVRNARMKEESSGLLGGKRALVHEVDMEFRSSLGFLAEVEVIDRIPVTDDANVQVEMIEGQPASAPYDQKEYDAPVRGGRRWKLVLKPGATSTIRYGYRIVLRAKDELWGGNRRE
ncbi:MAG: mucoidy inhibitor MuiA family protein [Bradymonadaceae bacterium]|nr:mucoidy inhibitor MuiA family protein [Lujinxingiaceae bacterium]